MGGYAFCIPFTLLSNTGWQINLGVVSFFLLCIHSNGQVFASWEEITSFFLRNLSLAICGPDISQEHSEQPMEAGVMFTKFNTLYGGADWPGMSVSQWEWTLAVSTESGCSITDQLFINQPLTLCDYVVAGTLKEPVTSCTFSPVLTYSQSEAQTLTFSLWQM